MAEHQKPESASAAMMADLCLAPDGNCACAEKLQGTPPGQLLAAACWRVRIPWWSLSPTLLPENRYSQLLGKEVRSSGHQGELHAASRVRTPSPPQAIDHVPPPKLVFAPAFVQPATPSSLARVWLADDSDALGTGSDIGNTQQQSLTSDDEASEFAGPGGTETSMVSKKRARRRHQRKGVALIIASQLAKLEEKDPLRVLTVRNISCLGFDSAKVLRVHFEQYGPVEEVLLANAHERSADIPRQTRLRPSGMGFVVMQNAADADRVLQDKEQHVLDGHTVHVRKFERRASDDTATPAVVEEDVGDAPAVPF